MGITNTRDSKQRYDAPGPTGLHRSRSRQVPHNIMLPEIGSRGPWSPPNQAGRGKPNRHCLPLSRGRWLSTYIGSYVLPDISFSVCQVAHFTESHNSSHIKAVHHIISYIRRTSGHVICHTESPGNPRLDSLIPTMWAGMTPGNRQLGASSFITGAHSMVKLPQ